MHPRGDLCRESSLADPRLAEQPSDVETATRIQRQLRQLDQLLLAPDERQPGLDHQRRWKRQLTQCPCVRSFPVHGTDRHRFGETLELEVADWRVVVAAAAAGHDPHEIRAEDLAGFGGGFEARGFDHRRAEAVTLLP